MPLKDGIYYISKSTAPKSKVLTAPSFSFKKKTSQDTQNQIFRVKHLTGHTYHIYGSKKVRIVTFPILAGGPSLESIDQGEDEPAANFLIYEDKDDAFAGGSYHSCTIAPSSNLLGSWFNHVYLIYLGRASDDYFDDAE